MAKEKDDTTPTLEQTVALLAQIAANQQGGINKADLQDLIDAQRKAFNPSNPTHPGKSVFSHPEGERAHPKTALDRETYFCGARQWEEQLTPAEIDAFNALQESCAIPERGEHCYVKVTPKRREVVVPAATRDQMQDLPNGLALVLMEFKHGAKAIDPLELQKQLADAQARIADLEDRLTQPV